MTKYLYADFTSSSCNYGNLVIEEATAQFLEKFNLGEKVTFDSFKSRPPTDEFSCVIVPGCTMITTGQNPGLEFLSEMRCPIYCLAGSLWQRLDYPGLLLRHRILFKEKRKIDLKIARMMTTPIGARDRFTYERLMENGIEAIYTGCPTLFLSARDVGDDGYVLFSFGREHLRRQVRAVNRLARKAPVIGLIHERGDAERIRAAGANIPLVDFMGDLQLYLSYLKRASCVITGRLHGLLPSIAFGKRVFYFGTKDTRTTILDDLGIHVHELGEIGDASEYASAAHNRAMIDYFKINFETLLMKTIGMHDSQPEGEHV